MPSEFLIVTHSDDLHGLAVQEAVRRRGYACHRLETDQLSGRESINYVIRTTEPCSALLRTSEGKLIDPASIQVIWWRRFKTNQQSDLPTLTESQQSLINNDCVGALIGSLLTTFTSKWISCPRATEYASNKLTQLAVARSCGLRIPDTVVTQSPLVVLDFFRRHEGRVIVKPVAGTPGPLLFTQFVQESHLLAKDSIRACPAIYQEYIPGREHIRLNCFGDRSFASLIETDDLDWRPNLDVPISKFTVPSALHRTIRTVLDALGLDMGIIDLKRTTDGDFVWLEVNPQGQFLFLEGLTKEPLTEYFAEYLIQCENKHSSRL